MNTLTEIKEKIKAGEIDEAMTMAMAKAMKLEIITFVDDANKQPSPPYLRTIIDLLENEIEHQISEDLINHSSYEKLKQIHDLEVQKGNERILQNIESIQKLFTMIKKNI